ncbi:MAG: hypothetical protein EBQ96_07490 [Proteobacteria bacterium]|nr:hypothetical protein [Pseudomonadota bacterium]
MAFTYEQKQALIAYLSNPVHWTNVFDMAFFSDETRRWKSYTYGDMTAVINDEGTKCILTHRHNGSSLTLEKLNDRTVITDESGHTVIIRGTSIDTKQDDVRISPVSKDPAATEAHNDNDEFCAALSQFGVYVGINGFGRKSVLVDAAGKKVVLDGVMTRDEKPAPRGKFFHAIEISEDAAEQLGLPVHGMMMGAKLVIALDMDLEPDIRLFNALDPDRVFGMALDFVKDKWDASWKGPWQWRPKVESTVGDISHLQKTWADSTQFEGHFVAAPMNFFIERTDTGYSLGLTLDGRERIWSHGTILKTAIDGSAPVIETVTSKTEPYTLLHLLRRGIPVRDHRDREWLYTLLRAKEAAGIAKQTRAALRTHFGLSGRDVAVINYADGALMMAGSVRSLEPVFMRDRATLERMALMYAGTLPPEAATAQLTPTS